MKRDIRIQIRWTEDEIGRINKARGSGGFSEFVREATMDKVIEYES